MADSSSTSGRGALRVVAALLAAASLLLTTACSTGGDTEDPAGPSNAHCDARLVEPFGCHDVLLLPGRYRAWFDTTRGARLVVEAPRGRILVPVVISRGFGTTAAVALDGPTTEQCAGDERCEADVALRTFFARVVGLQLTDGGFRLYIRQNEVGAIREDTMTSYLPVRAQRAGGYTALTAEQGNGDQALLRGELGFNAFGCATVGGAVVVLPPGSKVEDAAIVVGGERYGRGDRVELGGSELVVPPDDWRCGATERYWYAGPAD